jgi:outer membrane immunogenic protein
MNRLIFGAVALVAIAAPAYAADLAVKAPVYKAPPPVLTWAGFYAGASVGGVWADDKITDVDHLNNPAGFSYSHKAAGVIGSGVLGYNFQSGNFVYGVEADLGGMGFNGSISEPNALPFITTNHLGSGFYGDVTGRLGIAAAGALFYAKGGWAFFDGRASVFNDGTIPGSIGGGTATTGSFDGWTVGAGIEYLFAPCWSAKVEYQHFDFGSRTATLVATQGIFVGNPFRFSNDLTADALKIGVNYHFGH